MKILRSAAVLLVVFSLSQPAHAQRLEQVQVRFVGVPGDMQANWYAYEQYTADHLFDQIKRNSLRTEQYLHDHPVERGKEYGKQIKKLFKDIKSLCKLLRCKDASHDEAAFLEGPSSMDGTDISIIFGLANVSVEKRQQRHLTDAKDNVRVLAMKEAIERLQARLQP